MMQRRVKSSSKKCKKYFKWKSKIIVIVHKIWFNNTKNNDKGPMTNFIKCSQPHTMYDWINVSSLWKLSCDGLP